MTLPHGMFLTLRNAYAKVICRKRLTNQNAIFHNSGGIDHSISRLFLTGRMRELKNISSRMGQGNWHFPMPNFFDRLKNQNLFKANLKRYYQLINWTILNNELTQKRLFFQLNEPE